MSLRAIAYETIDVAKLKKWLLPVRNTGEDRRASLAMTGKS
jgi:hypothetical protein